MNRSSEITWSGEMRPDDDDDFEDEDDPLPAPTCNYCGCAIDAADEDFYLEFLDGLMQSDDDNILEVATLTLHLPCVISYFRALFLSQN